MKRVIIELWIPDEEEVNDVNVGKALGVAVMTNDLKYSIVPYIEYDEDDLKEEGNL